MSLAPGTRLGPYEIIAAIGAGGMGQVYRARDTRLDRDVAIKVLPSAAFMAATLGDLDALLRFTEEATAEQDPNIGFAIRSHYFRLLHADPRYHDLLRRINLANVE